MTDKNKGFTIIELLLAMSFIAFMLLFIVSSILQVTKLYIKGTSIRQIDQTGRQLLEEVGATLRNNTAPIDGTSNNRLCAGGISYVWNVDGEAVKNVYSGTDEPVPIRFVSVQDATGSLCTTDLNVPIARSNAVELIGYDITPLEFSVSKKGRLWDIFLVLSTSGTNIATKVEDPPEGLFGFACDPQNQFCALGDFMTSVYTRGE